MLRDIVMSKKLRGGFQRPACGRRDPAPGDCSIRRAGEPRIASRLESSKPGPSGRLPVEHRSELLLGDLNGPSRRRDGPRSCQYFRMPF